MFYNYLIYIIREILFIYNTSTVKIKKKDFW